jgi:hypothetical protein
MNKHTLLRLCALALFLPIACASARNDALADTPEKTSAAEVGVRKVIADYVAAFNERDAAGGA